MAPLPIRILLGREEAKALNQELLAQPLAAVDLEGYGYIADDVDEETDAEVVKKSPVENGLALSLQFSYRRSEGIERIYMHNHGDSAGNVYELEEYFASKRVKVFHNASGDMHTLMNHGIRVVAPVWDTMVEAHGLDQNRKFKGGYGLKALTEHWLGRPRTKYTKVFGSPKLKKDGTPYASGQMEVPGLVDYLMLDQYPPPSNMADVLAYGKEEFEAYCLTMEAFMAGRITVCPEVGYWGRWYNFLVYATNDSWDTLELHEHCRRKYEALPWGKGTYWDYIETFAAKETSELIYPLERKGMLLDLPFLRLQRERCERDMQELECKAVEWAGCPLELGKARQLTMLLHGSGMQPIYKGASPYKGGPKSKVAFYIPGREIPVLDYTEKGAPATDKDAIAKLERWAEEHDRDDLAGLKYVVAYGQADKQKGTYLEGMAGMALPWREHPELGYGRLHTRLNQTGTSSGRWAPANPNLANITVGKKDTYHLRDAFIAPPGKVLIVWDAKNLEYRLLAHFSQDPQLIRMFNEGHDMHSLYAYDLFPYIRKAVDDKFGECNLEAQAWIKEEYAFERDKRAKTINFSIIYGVGAGKIAEQFLLDKVEAKRLKISVDEAAERKLGRKAGQKMLDAWFARFARVLPWREGELNGARQNGYIRTLMGRYRFAEMDRLLSNDRGIRGEEERTIANAKIQGSAKDLIVAMMLKIAADKELKEMGYEMTMQVHDEVVGECPIATHKPAMERLKVVCWEPFGRKLRLDFPISIGAAPSWATAKS